MKSLTLFCGLLLSVLSALAQEFDTHWIAAPTPDSTAHMWFRQTYLPGNRAEEAHISVTTTGYFKLYVNECIVGTALFYPYRDGQTDEPMTATFDVTPFLRANTNVVALIYSPAFPQANRRQIAVSFYGREANGQPFCHYSDRNWLCRQANSRMKTGGGEYIDGRAHTTSWRATEYDPALWVGVEESTGHPTSVSPASSPCLWAPDVVHRRSYNYFDNTDSGTEYEFKKGFVGMVRLTIRNATRGERISLDNTDYICNGELDEQACPQFAIENHRRVTVSGDGRFRRDQITDIEAIETGLSTHCP